MNALYYKAMLKEFWNVYYYHLKRIGRNHGKNTLYADGKVVTI